MNERVEDPVGTGVAFLAGALLGIVLAGPMLPRTLPVTGVVLGPLEVVLVSGSVAIVAVGLALLVMYIFFAQRDRL